MIIREPITLFVALFVGLLVALAYFVHEAPCEPQVQHCLAQEKAPYDPGVPHQIEPEQGTKQ